MKLIAKAQEDKTVFILLTVVSFLSGIICGFLISPIKRGISVGNTSISNNEPYKLPYYDGKDDNNEINPDQRS